MASWGERDEGGGREVGTGPWANGAGGDERWPNFNGGSGSGGSGLGALICGIAGRALAFRPRSSANILCLVEARQRARSESCLLARLASQPLHAGRAGHSPHTPRDSCRRVAGFRPTAVSRATAPDQARLV